MKLPVNPAGKIFTQHLSYPLPGSEGEKTAFRALQKSFAVQYENVFPDKLAPRTVVIIPSLSLDQEILSKIKGAVHYEERMLCLLLLLRMPRTRVIYVTSVPIADSIVDYYLHLLPGITGRHALKRLSLISCHDSSIKPLTQKILDRPRLIEKIIEQIPDKDSAHLTCFNITSLEKSLAVRLGIPLFGTDPDLAYEGTKSGGRKSFREAGVDFPKGFEDLRSREKVIEALTSLKYQNPELRKAVVKINDGFSGDGNAIYTYPPIETNADIGVTINNSFSQQLKMVAQGLSEELFFTKLEEMHGIVEEFLEGDIKMSPSVQCVISPDKKIDIVSTHDQILGGDDNQVYLGAEFPANKEYSLSLAASGRKIAEVLASKGAIGRFAIDFITVKQDDGTWKHYAIEINLRKGGTTHPLLMLQFLTDGRYDETTGDYRTASGHRRHYYASDNVIHEKYKGLTPDDLIDISIYHDLMFDGATKEGIMFHLIGALSEFGKFGVLCVGTSPEKAKEYYHKIIRVLDLECD